MYLIESRGLKISIKKSELEQLPPILTCKHLQLIMQISPDDVYRIMRLKSFPIKRIHRRICVFKKDFISWCNSQRSQKAFL